MKFIPVVVVIGFLVTGLLTLGRAQDVTHTWVLSESSTSALNKILTQLEGPSSHESSIRTLEDISKKFPIPIFLDKRSLADASISLEESVDVPIVEGQSLRNYLSMMLQQLSLNWSIEHDQLVITAEWHGEVSCLYDLTPVLIRNGEGPKSIGASYRAIVDVIESSISPDVWQSNSGNSTIVPWRLGEQYFAIIRAPVSVHLEVQDFFRSSQRIVDHAQRSDDNISFTRERKSTKESRLARPNSIRRSRLK